MRVNFAMNHLPGNQNIFTVSEISQKIRDCLESRFPQLWIKGELSNFIAHSSGHWYFSLKDERAQIKGVMFRGQNQKLSFRPQTGEEVLVQGQISVYPPRGDYQILCHEMEIVGSGLLQRQFEQIKTKLKKEGLFDQARKRELPPFPRHIILITSPTGAAVRDILHILKRRFKAVRVTLIPALVQGEQAPASLLSALELSKQLFADALIIGRGGGSMEDLWAFNDENLARAISRHPIPVISAVGHEIDFTICDFVADLRVPTPSSAAELVVQNVNDLLDKIQRLKKQLTQNINIQLAFLKDRLLALEKSWPSPDRLLRDASQRLDEINLRMAQSLKQTLERAKERLKSCEQILTSLNPKTIMRRGFSIVSNAKGDLICGTKELKIKESLTIDFYKGRAKALVTEKE